MHAPPNCFVLAGGKSTRFGSNKSLAYIDERNMASVVANNMHIASGSAPRLIGADEHTSGALGLLSIAGSREGNGPLAALIDALEFADSGVVLIAPNDTPFFSSDSFIRLIASLDTSQADVAVAVDSCDVTLVHWLLSAWRKDSCLATIQEQYLRGVRSVHEAVIGLQVTTVAYEASLVRNINRVSDLSQDGTI